LLAADVVSWADGGGKARAARRPISGRARVVRYLLGGMGKFARDMDITIVEVNGAPSVVGWSRGRLAGVLVPELVAGRSEMDARFGALRIVVNPDKLTVLSRQLAEVSRVGGLSPTT
jgi:RNA polymerase sigma-70 factor (ECF subfamily)